MKYFPLMILVCSLHVKTADMFSFLRRLAGHFSVREQVSDAEQEGVVMTVNPLFNAHFNPNTVLNDDALKNGYKMHKDVQRRESQPVHDMTVSVFEMAHIPSTEPEIAS